MRSLTIQLGTIADKNVQLVWTSLFLLTLHYNIL